MCRAQEGNQTLNSVSHDLFVRPRYFPSADCALTGGSVQSDPRIGSSHVVAINRWYTAIAVGDQKWTDPIHASDLELQDVCKSLEAWK